MNRKSFLKKAGLGSAGLLGSSLAGPMGMLGGCDSPKKPNILLIMADDMGFSDIGCYGGEVATPNINRLATNGLRFSQFYNAARCCPTRASLLTGLYPHQTGIGLMTQDLGYDAYQGDLNNHCVTIAEVLGNADYSTWMCGKWHVTKHTGLDTNDTDKHNWPLQRGFDRFFGTIIGAGSYYSPASLTRDNERIQPDPGFYYTDAITDNATNFITDHFNGRSQDPFFGYVAYTAPHWPLHAPEEDIAKYNGRYRDGWDTLRQRRMQRMIDIGLIDPQWKLTKRDPRIPTWREAQHKAWEQRRMETYAAQIDRMDCGIGRIIQILKQNGQWENTLIFFLSDNGGCAEVLTEGWRKYNLPAIP